MMLCADIGNSGIRVGAWQTGPNAIGHPQLLWRKAIKKPVEFSHAFSEPDLLPGAGVQWNIASVNAPLLNQLSKWLQEFRPLDSTRVLHRNDISLTVDVDNPDGVGIDRLISSWAAWAGTANQPAIVVDAGSAVTVDLVDATGRFRGGNIFPGTSACLRALSVNTDRLPLLTENGAFPDTPFGRSTSAAIFSGVYRMQAAAIVSLVRQLQEFASAGDGQVSLTGGGIPALRPLLPAWRYTEHLIVDGIRELVTR